MRALAAIAALVVLGIVPSAQERQFVDMFVLTEKNAYLVTPAKLVTDGNVGDVHFSPDGKSAYLFGWTESAVDWTQALSASVHGTIRPFVKIWDLASGGVREASPAVTALLMSPDLGSPGESVMWTSQPGVGLILLNEFSPNGTLASTGLTRINLNDGSVSTVLKFAPLGGFADDVVVSPKAPRFVHVRQSFSNPVDRADIKTTFDFSVCDLSGRETKRGHAEVRGRAHFSNWTQDGKHLVGWSTIVKTPGVKPVSNTIVLNADTGVISETKEEIKVLDEEAPESGPLAPVVAKSLTQLGEDKAPTQSLWLAANGKSEDPQCLVANGVDGPHWLSPSLSHIAYVAQGRLFASQIVKLDLAAYLKAKEEAERAVAMSNTKQVALGLIIYAADSDDLLPPQAGYQDAIYPYLKNRDVMNGFVYTYSGGSLAKLDDPAGTEIGYVSVAGGRCVAFADGHVKFIKG